MGFFKYFSILGAVCLLYAALPGANMLFITRMVGAVALLWGAVYFLLEENETLYGSVCVIFCVLVQPIYDIPYSAGMWMLIGFTSAVYLLLSGLLCAKLSKQRLAERAKTDVELEMYRKNESKLKAQQQRDIEIAEQKERARAEKKRQKELEKQAKLEAEAKAKAEAEAKAAEEKK